MKSFLAISNTKPYDAKKQISTFEDAIFWLDNIPNDHLSGSAWYIENNNQYLWKNSAAYILEYNEGLTGGIYSYLVSFLLEDDFNTGAIGVYKSGSHNYITYFSFFKDSDNYYVVDTHKCSSNTNIAKIDNYDEQEFVNIIPNCKVNNLNALKEKLESKKVTSAVIIEQVNYTTFIEPKVGFFSMFNNKLLYGSYADLTLDDTNYNLQPDISELNDLYIGDVGTFPSEFKGRVLSDSQIKELYVYNDGYLDLNIAKENISTVEDAIAYIFGIPKIKIWGDYFDNSTESTKLNDICGINDRKIKQNEDDYLHNPCQNLCPESINQLIGWLISDDYDVELVFTIRIQENLTNNMALLFKQNEKYYLCNPISLYENKLGNIGMRTTLTDNIVANSVDDIKKYFKVMNGLSGYGDTIIYKNPEEKLAYYIFNQVSRTLDNGTTFVVKGDFSYLYEEVCEKTLAEKIVYSGTTNYRGTSFDIEDKAYQIDSEISKTTMTYEEAKALANETPKVIQEKIKTVGDIIQYMHAVNFHNYDETADHEIRVIGDTYITAENNARRYFSNYEYDYAWHYNDGAEKVINQKRGDCGGCANMGNYLLAGDYEEVGYMCHTYENGNGGGHIYNYIKTNDSYYVFDLDQIQIDGYYPTVLSLVFKCENLEEWAAECHRRYDNVALIYYYTNEQDMFIVWKDNEYVTYFPTSSKINIIYQEEGYSTGEIELSKEIENEIKKQSNSRVINMDDFVGLDSFNFESDLLKATLTSKEIEALSDKSLDEAANKIKTIGDLLMYFYGAGYTSYASDSGDIKVEAPEDGIYHFNSAAERTISFYDIGCGQTAQLVRYLLDGDYDEVGYMCHTYENGGDGGHVYNYIKYKGNYYVFDMVLLTSIDNAVYFNSDLNFIVNVGEKLENYKDYITELGTSLGNIPYGNPPLIYSYTNLREYSIMWQISDVSTTTLPLEAKDDVKIIKEEEIDGTKYKLEFASIDKGIQEFINFLRY